MSELWSLVAGHKQNAIWPLLFVPVMKETEFVEIYLSLAPEDFLMEPNNYV